MLRRLAHSVAVIVLTLSVVACGNPLQLFPDAGAPDASGNNNVDAGRPSVASGTFSGTYSFTNPGTCQAVGGTISSADVAFLNYASTGAGQYNSISVTAVPASSGGGSGGAGLTTVSNPASLPATLSITFCIAGVPSAGTFTQATTAQNSADIGLTVGSLATGGADGFQAVSAGTGAVCASTGATSGTYQLVLTSATAYNAVDYDVHGSLNATMGDKDFGGPGCSLTLQLSF
jgi:hypothetical protein